MPSSIVLPRRRLTPSRARFCNRHQRRPGDRTWDRASETVVTVNRGCQGRLNAAKSACFGLKQRTAGPLSFSPRRLFGDTLLKWALRAAAGESARREGREHVSLSSALEGG